MRSQSEGMREDIEGERGKKSAIRGMQRSHWWPSGNTQLGSGNMTVADAPDGRWSGKSVKKKKKKRKGDYKRGYRVWGLEKTCICMLYLPVLSLHSKAELQPHPAHNLPLPCLWRPAVRNYPAGRDPMTHRKRKKTQVKFRRFGQKTKRNLKWFKEKSQTLSLPPAASGLQWIHQENKTYLKNCAHRKHLY